MRRRLAVLLVASAFIAWPAPEAPARSLPVHAVAAKSCSAGYKHAVIGGAHKCLRRGQFCAMRYRSTYRRYGFNCAGGRLR
jgi:hypothetical protein